VIEGIEWTRRKLEQIDRELGSEKISFDFDDTLTRKDIQENPKRFN